MADWGFRFVLDAVRYIALTTVSLLAICLYSPRLLLRSYPPAIQRIVPVKTTTERWMSLLLGLPFLIALFAFPAYATFTWQAATAHDAGFLQLWAYASAIAFMFNLWDWLILDWVVVCTVTPRWLVIPGTEGHPAYKDYLFHFKSFVIGTVFSGVLGAVSAGMTMMLRAWAGR